jgi:hypothetical protein
VNAEISNQRAAILSGAAFAAVAGILLGGAMRPQLAFDDRPMGPQMFAAGGGPRSTGPFDNGAAFASYREQIPTYVIGTDYAQQAYVEAPPIAEDRPQMARNDQPPPEAPPLTRATYEEASLPEVVYPSMAGGRAYDAETPSPPALPDEEAPTIIG